MRKRKLPRQRNPLVPLMWLQTKPGPHKDKRKEAARKACRVNVRSDPYDSPPGRSLDPGEVFPGTLNRDVSICPPPAIFGGSPPAFRGEAQIR